MKRHIFDSEEQWLKFRERFFTSSEIHKLMPEPTKIEIAKGEVLSKGAKTYIEEIAVNILSEAPFQFYNYEMQRGKEAEPQAALAFAEHLGMGVNDDDFIYTSVGGIVFFTDDKEVYGGTPDILVRRKCAEIKCPKGLTHLKNLQIKSVHEFRESHPDYYDQIQLNIHLSSSEGSYFISFDDRFKSKKHHLFVLEVPKDNERIEQILNKIEAANEYLQNLIKQLH